MFVALKLFQVRVERALRRSALAAGAVVLLLVGAGFLLSAAWLLLAQWQSALFASLIIGVIFAGIGLVVLALAMRADPPTPRDEMRREFRRHARSGGLDPPTAGEYPPLMEAFLFGLTTAMRLKRRRRPGPADDIPGGQRRRERGPDDLGN